MIRPATSADRDAIVALHLASWRSSYGVVLPEPVLREELPGYLAEKWAARDFGAGQLTLVAARGDEIDGFLCALTDRPIPLIDNLHVAPARRGAAIGARLLDAGLRELARGGARQAELTVLEENAGARRFYLSRGARDLGPEDDTLVGRPVRVRRMRFALR